MTRVAVRVDVLAHKYHARRVQIDGEWFDSKGEAKRWAELLLLHKAGWITKPARQVVFDLYVTGAHGVAKIGTYRADYVYQENRGTYDCPRWVRVVEDFKGVDTPLSEWKRKHVEAEYGVTIRLTHGRS